MKNYIDELFEIHKEKTFEQFLLDELNHYVQQVELNWAALIDMGGSEWLDYQVLLDNISRNLTIAINFIEHTQGPEIVSILYGEIFNYIEDKILHETVVSNEDYAQIQYIMAALGACIQPEILELSLVEEGELQDHLTQQILSALEKFGKE